MGFYANKIFPWILDKSETPELSEQRAITLKDASGDILEIGLGTGGNLPFYPKSVTKLTAVEPSEGMHQRAARRATENKRKIEWHRAMGEDLPFDEGRFDTVVTTQLLCSVRDVEKVLGEAFRVLKPGGKYYFLEHVRSNDPKIYNWQRRLNKLHRRVACGCELIRDIERSIQNSKFELKECHQIPLFQGLDQKIYQFIRGFAIKAE